MSKWVNKTHIGDCRRLLADMALAGVRVQTCVTSPPYWGLRDYGVDGQIGLESSLDAWLAEIVRVFALVRHVLADDGTLWVNMGDAYNAGTNAKRKAPETDVDVGGWNDAEIDGGARVLVRGLKPKDLIGQPWRVAFALQADGWHLRSDIVWHKPNPMPESVTDRPTKAHEYVFLLSKAPRYHYDASAIAEPVTGNAHARGNGVNKKIKMPDGWDTGPGAHGSFHRSGREKGKTHSPKDAGCVEHGLRDSTKFGRGAGWRAKQNPSFSAAVSGLVEKRNARTVWTIPTEQFSAAHFATFPQELARRCVLAGSRPGDTVLDPFMGSGTVGQVATDLGRNFIGCELNPKYVELHEMRRTTIGMPI